MTLTPTQLDAPPQWLTPNRCRWTLALLLLAGIAAHLFYLIHNCPIDLAGDEAQYWDWSRQLGLSYYSKGPLIAYIIRASCALFGNNMPAVRLPALLLGAGTSIITYLLTLRLFRSQPLALGVVLLCHLVPVFIAGSLLITIDAPFFFCWALATYLAAIAIFDNKPRLWPLIGLVVGIGALAKYAMLLWLPIAGATMLFDTQGRRLLRTPLPWLACAFALVCTTPVLIWNAQHNWVTFRHVARQTGASGGAFLHGDVLLLIGSQAGVVGPTLTVLMLAAMFDVWRNRHTDRKGVFLTTFGVGFWLFNLLASLFAKAQVNWPAPAYFTLTILTARFIAIKMQSPATWRIWCPWFYATIMLGLLFLPLAHDAISPLPIIRHLTEQPGESDSLRRAANSIPFIHRMIQGPEDADILARLRGWHTLGNLVSNKLASLPPGAFVMCDDYQQTAEMAFYVRNQPRTYCAGPYFGNRLSQYDMWPDRRLDRTSPLLGHDAVYVGKGDRVPRKLTDAFASIEPRQDLDIIAHGVKIRTFKTYLCHGFKGFDAIANHSSSESF
jgi:hypothetical protein